MIATEEMKAKIYSDYSHKVLSYFNSRLNNLQTAEDLCSDVFLKVFEKLDTFDDTKASISTWIFTITRNRLTDFYRTRKVTDEIPETLEDSHSQVEDEACNNDMLNTLTFALKKLDERERDIIILRYYKGVTLKDIAAKMGISYAYVKVLHNKAVALLKDYLGE